MKSVFEACLVGSFMIAGAGALYSQKPVLTVEMPVAGHAVEMRAADEQNATVVAMTADGRVFVGVEPTEPAALSRLSARTVYLIGRRTSRVSKRRSSFGRLARQIGCAA
jgi:hypothetical protein